MTEEDDGPACQATRLCALPGPSPEQPVIVHARPGGVLGLAVVDMGKALQQGGAPAIARVLDSAVSFAGASPVAGSLHASTSAVQSIASWQSRFAASNDRGQVVVGVLHDDFASVRSAAVDFSEVDGPCERGYAHVAFSPSGSSLMTSRLFQRESLVVDVEAPGAAPTARFEHELAAMGCAPAGEGVWAVAEYGDLTAWDARAAKPLVTRMASNRFGAGDVFYSVAAHGDYVALAGAARVVSRVDRRKWVRPRPPACASCGGALGGLREETDAAPDSQRAAAAASRWWTRGRRRSSTTPSRCCCATAR